MAVFIVFLSISSKSIAQVNSATVKDVDGNVYKTVLIGTQTWMAENLKTTKYNDSTTIPFFGYTGWGELSTPGYCWMGNQVILKNSFGALYNGYTVDAANNGGKNVCPTGWHVPSDAEWTTLTNYLGGKSVAGGKLKSAITDWGIPTNKSESGFNAPLGGCRANRNFNFFTKSGYWWSTTECVIKDTFYIRWMLSGNTKVLRTYANKMLGFSVRCLKD